MVDYKVYPLEIALELFSEEEIHNAFRKFSCSVDSDLESFLVNKAENYELHWKGRTFLLLDQREFEENNTIRIIAYFTLAHIRRLSQFLRKCAPCFRSFRSGQQGVLPL